MRVTTPATGTRADTDDEASTQEGVTRETVWLTDEPVTDVPVE
jgi:hypothetical protein